jgi:hypothetical protein
MKTKPRILLHRYLILVSFICVHLWSCSPAPTPTPFIPPTSQAPLIEPALIIVPTPTSVPSQLIIPLPTIIPTTDPSNCVNDLTFVEDLTVPDYSILPFGVAVDKQWLVENSGTCNWDSGYRLRRTGGAILGALEETALFPARSGMQAIIRIVFTTPFEEGAYESIWQAFDPNGIAFGDPIYMRIVVSP